MDKSFRTGNNSADRLVVLVVYTRSTLINLKQSLCCDAERISIVGVTAEAMRKRLKGLLVLVLMLVVQMQPLQVHAIALDAEQSGHIAGQLSHRHHPPPSEAHDGQRAVVDAVHVSECHPAHTLCTVIFYSYAVVRVGTGVYSEPVPGYPSPDLSRELPPPKSES